jgi:glycosyltransferase involved in cell wall biosynthesis
MASPPVVAVLMATYNGEKYIKAQLASIASQTRRPDYLVVSDDGSADKTIELLQEFAGQRAIPVQLRQQRARLGYSDNFFSLMKECTADIVFLSDQDDVWHDDKIEKIVETFGSNKCLLISHDITITKSNIEDVMLESYFSALAESCIPPSFNVKGCSLAYKREFVDFIGWPPSDQSWTHDTWLCLISSALGVRDFVRQPLMRHRIHGLNVSGMVFAERSSWKKMLRRFDDRFWPMSEMDRLVANCVDPVGIESFESQMRRLVSVNGCRTEAALQAILRKKNIVRLQRSPAYGRALSRMIGSLKLFAKGDYLSYGNLSGLLADIKGIRQCQVDLRT